MATMSDDDIYNKYIEKLNDISIIYELLKIKYNKLILTGSAVLLFYYLHLPKDKLVKFISENLWILEYNDIDLYINKQFIYYTSFDKYKSSQTHPQHSKTFSYNDKHFDILCANRQIINYNIICFQNNNICVITPIMLLSIYEENQRECDNRKILLLKNISIYTITTQVYRMQTNITSLENTPSSSQANSPVCIKKLNATSSSSKKRSFNEIYTSSSSSLINSSTPESKRIIPEFKTTPDLYDENSSSYLPTPQEYEISYGIKLHSNIQQQPEQQIQEQKVKRSLVL